MAAHPRRVDVVCEVQHLCFKYPDDSRPTVNDVSFQLCRGRTLAILGLNEAGKTTVGRLVLGRLRPRSGRVFIGAAAAAAAQGSSTPEAEAASAAPAWVRQARTALLGACTSSGAIAVMQGGLSVVLLIMLALALAAFSGYELAYTRLPPTVGRLAERAPPHMGLITSEDSPGQALPAKKRIDDLIMEKMPAASTVDKRKAALRYLHEARFQMYDDHGKPWGTPEEYFKKGLLLGQLSGGQRHLMHILRELAARPDLLVCDELLCGLDLTRKAHMVRLLRKQQREDGTAILYLTVDFASAHVVADELAFMKDGCFLEGPGPAIRMLDHPKHKDFKAYVDESVRQEAMARGQHLRAEVVRLEQEE